MESASLKGQFLVRIRDKHGRLKKELVAFNGITDFGKDELLGIMFASEDQTVAWFVGLIDDSPALADGDIMSDHAGWTENEDYDEGTRPAWPEDAPASQQITNSSAVVFTMDASVTIAGFFLTSGSAKGGTTGTLWCTALFAEGDQVVADNDTIELTYVLSAAGA